MTQPNRVAAGCLLALLLALPLDVALIVLAITHPVGFFTGFGGCVMALIMLGLVRRK